MKMVALPSSILAKMVGRQAVAGGAQSQRIEIDSRNPNPASKDRYAGIYQTISVAKGLNIH